MGSYALPLQCVSCKKTNDIVRCASLAVTHPVPPFVQVCHAWDNRLRSERLRNQHGWRYQWCVTANTCSRLSVVLVPSCCLASDVLQSRFAAPKGDGYDELLIGAYGGDVPPQTDDPMFSAGETLTTGCGGRQGAFFKFTF